MTAKLDSKAQPLAGEFKPHGSFRPSDLPTVMRKAFDLLKQDETPHMTNRPLCYDKGNPQNRSEAMSDTAPIVPRTELAKLSRALPFWISLALLPIVWIGAVFGGWTLLIVPLVTWYLFTALDAAIGLNTENADLSAQEDDLLWYKLITLVWAPLQIIMLLGLLWYVPQAEHLGTAERIGVFFGVGVITGTVGINYSHELMHQTNKYERWMADLLLAMVLYSHFRSEHLLVHHRYVGTPVIRLRRDITKGFTAFIPVFYVNLFSARFAPRRACSRGKTYLGRTSAIHSGGIGGCNSFFSRSHSRWAAGLASGCFWCRRAWRSGSWNW